MVKKLIIKKGLQHISEPLKKVMKKAKKPKIDKGRNYNKKAPVVLVFKTSNRSNAKTKMKIFRNENIDYVLTAPKLVGVPETAIVVDCGVGNKFIEQYKLKYNL